MLPVTRQRLGLSVSASVAGRGSSSAGSLVVLTVVPARLPAAANDKMNLQALQPGAAPALSLAVLDPALIEICFSTLSFADKCRVLQESKAFKQVLTQPYLLLLTY